jgi:hypothetical protein
VGSAIEEAHAHLEAMLFTPRTTMATALREAERYADACVETVLRVAQEHSLSEWGTPRWTFCGECHECDWKTENATAEERNAAWRAHVLAEARGAK